MADWSAQQYLKFEDERTRPPRDLLAQIPLSEARKIVDIGCGPGNSTELLVRRWPNATVIGIDTSADMLRQARERLPQQTFIEANVAHWVPPEGTDLLFANAIFQWVPGHLKQLQRLLGRLPAGGVLAVQIPDSLEEPAHLLMREVASEGPWARQLSEKARLRDEVPPPNGYYDALSPLCTHLDIWHTIYNHPLADADAVVEWVKGTGLRPFIDDLDDPTRARFMASYRRGIDAAYPARADGKRLFPFPRLFLIAVR